MTSTANLIVPQMASIKQGKSGFDKMTPIIPLVVIIDK